MSYVVLVCVLGITLFGRSLYTRTVLTFEHLTYITPLKVMCILLGYNNNLLAIHILSIRTLNM